MRQNQKHINGTNRSTTALFIVYIVVLLWILLFKLGVRFSYMEQRSVSLVPFDKPLIANGKVDLSEIILNAVIFIPFGMYTEMLFERWGFGRKLFLILAASTIIEALQYTLAVGAFDITDIITNTFGGVIGLVFFKTIEWLFGDHVKAQRFMNILATLGTTLIVLLLVLLKLNMLPLRYQ